NLASLPRDLANQRRCPLWADSHSFRTRPSATSHGLSASLPLPLFGEGAPVVPKQREGGGLERCLSYQLTIRQLYLLSRFSLQFLSVSAHRVWLDLKWQVSLSGYVAPG